MPRVLPSDVVAAADRMFADMAQTPTSFPQIDAHRGPTLAALAQLVDAVPIDLIRLDPTQYTGLVAAVAFLRAVPAVFQASRVPIQLRIAGYEENAIALIRQAMAICPDESPSAETATLSFVADPALRDSIRSDISAANTNLVQGEWKGATVLAGAAVEALLLWALQDAELKTPGTIQGVPGAPGKPLDRWELHEYISVTKHLAVSKQDTAAQADQARTFRNLIHPGRAQRLAQTCDRGTALAALSAVEFVVRDLTP